MKMGSTTRPLGRCLLRGGGQVRVDLGKYQVVCHRGQRSSPEDEVGGSTPPRPTIRSLSSGNAARSLGLSRLPWFSKESTGVGPFSSLIALRPARLPAIGLPSRTRVP